MARQSRQRPDSTPTPGVDRGGTRTAAGIYHLLDMGRQQYGDCILCRFGDKTVLIDAGHPADFDGQQGYESIPDQLAGILGAGPPFNLTLLVVTHAHNDHIGCLPKMIEAGMLKPKFALVADPDLGFPPGFRDALDGLQDLDAPTASAIAKAVAGLLEEDHSFLDAADLESFLDAATTLGVRYRTMLRTLEDEGTKLFYWGRTAVGEMLPIYRALAGTGFDVIGPSVPQLESCRDQIIEYSRQATDTILDAMRDGRLPNRDDGSPSASLIYKAFVSGELSPSADLLIDRRGTGSALNCQSIVIKFGEGDQKVLLAGDMQFVEPQVDGLDAEMKLLREKAKAAGPYRFVKTTHHTSYNGLDLEVWTEFGKPPLLVHSGGLNDDAHPERGALTALKTVDDDIMFARTDKNGLVTVDPSKRGARAIEISRGRIDDFTPNRRRARDEVAQATSAGPQTEPQTSQLERPEMIPNRGFVDILMMRIPYEDGQISIDGRTFAISGRSPMREAPPLTGRNDQESRAGPLPHLIQRRPGALGGGRDLSHILFVTHAGKLTRNLGQLEATRALRMIEDGGATLLKIDSAGNHETAVRQKLANGRYAGVTIVGGYDVVPSQRVDVLDPTLRNSVPRSAITDDRDEFVVWSDDVYGDVEGDNMPDLPVSRIPDGRTPTVLFTALQAKKPDAARGRFGVRNVKRPFATAIFALLPGNEDLLQSAPMRFNQIPRNAASRPFIYLMLHGLDQDGSRFWGDNPAGGGPIEAINTTSLPKSGLGVALAGCCWGALTVDQRANDRSGALSPKPPESSMALSVLAGGALAFVGCTGTHYSPDEAGGFFGGPMHRAFWRQLTTNGRGPAEALFEARKEFLAEMPHGRRSPLELAIERKIYKQFTCLGLGW